MNFHPNNLRSKIRPNSSTWPTLLVTESVITNAPLSVSENLILRIGLLETRRIAFVKAMDCRSVMPPLGIQGFQQRTSANTNTGIVSSKPQNSNFDAFIKCPGQSA